MATSRRLAAILTADIAGCSRVIGADEDLGEQALKSIARPVRVFRVRTPLPNPPPRAGEGREGVRPRKRWGCRLYCGRLSEI
jgi:hypothetical protein